MSFVRFAALAALIPALLVAQSSSSGLSSATRAHALLDSAIVANGGLARLRAVKDVSIRYRGRRWMAYQSKTLTRPWDTQPTSIDLVLDLENNRIARQQITRYPLDFVFAIAQLTTPQVSYVYDPTRAGMGDAISRFPGGSVATSPLRRELPAFQLMQARERAETVRWLGERTEGGVRLRGISYAEANGAVYELWIDAVSKRLVNLDWVRDDPVDGDQLARYTFSGYRVEQGVTVPSRLVERRNGELIRDDTLTITIDTHPAASVFAPPATGYGELADARPTGPEGEAIRKLADNVWLLQQLPGNNRVLFVAFRDYVVVFEAPTPQSAATAVMDAVRRTVPGKPIKYVTFSHHHDDHAGGLRPYIAEGVTVVTTPTNRKFVELVAAAKHTMRPDALSLSPKKPVIETFSTKRVFTDGDMTMELHELGANSHVDEMVFAYFPKEKLVFQGDLLILPDRGDPNPANTLTTEFLKAIDRLGLDVQTIAGVHGSVGTKQKGLEGWRVRG